MIKVFCSVCVFLFLSIFVFLISGDAVSEEKKLFEKVLKFNFSIGDEYSDAPEYAFYKPSSMASDSKGNIYIVDSGNTRVVKFDAMGKYVLQWGRHGQGPEDFDFLVGHGHLNAANRIFIDRNDKVYISDVGNGSIKIFDEKGGFVRSLKLEKSISSFSVNSKGIVYVAAASVQDELDRYMHVYNRRGKLIKKFGKPLVDKKKGYIAGPGGNQIVHDENDNLYLVLMNLPYIFKFSKDDELIYAKRIPVYSLKRIKGKNREFDLSWKKIYLRNFSSNMMSKTRFHGFTNNLDYYRGKLYVVYFFWPVVVLQLDAESGELEGGYYFPEEKWGRDEEGKCIFSKVSKINRKGRQLMSLCTSKWHHGIYLFSFN